MEKKPEGFIDVPSLSTYNPDTEEICCPNCGSWTTMEDLEWDEDALEHSCALCKQ